MQKDKDDLEQEVQMGKQAKTFVDDPMFIGAVSTLCQALDKEWLNTQPADIDKREMIWHRRQAVADIVGVLRSTVNAGVVAEDILEKEKKEKEEK